MFFDEVGYVFVSVNVFKNLVNILYSRELSKKIRSAQMARNEEYLYGDARYGYEKSPEDKHWLVVDPEVARKIFTMAAGRLWL
ncbi:hypothetical protein D5282_00880 [bacterium 1xD8-48]|nr:hypothetical protein [bacterium 1xD8-48]